MTTTFITGASKGLGYQAARRLAELGHHVIIGARDPERGQAAAGRLGVRFVPIDVTDDVSVTNAAADIEAHEGRVDTLVNNAGIIGSHASADELTGQDAEHVFATNVTGIVRVTSAFLPLLGKPQAARHPSSRPPLGRVSQIMKRTAGVRLPASPTTMTPLVTF